MEAENSAILGAILDSSLDAIVGMNERGAITVFNCAAEEMFEITRAEVLDRELCEVIIPTDLRTQHKAGLAACLENGSGDIIGERVELSAIRSDGKIFPIELTINRLQGDVPNQFIGFIRDISDRKEAEKHSRRLQGKVRESQRLESLRALAGGVAHDFNNLLVGILGNAGLALSELTPDSQARPHVEDVERVAAKARELCHQLLAYSGRGRFVIEPLDLSGVVREAADLMRATVARRAELTFVLNEGLPPVEGDATQLHQIALNLLTNASEAVGESGGRICVKTGMVACDGSYLGSTHLNAELSPGLYVFMEISDNGSGMDRSTRDQIFDPFFTTKSTGRGLGLAAVASIIKSHGGAISVYSEPEQGTVFKVLLPAQDGAAVVSPQTQEISSDWRGHGTVLLIDDDEIVRRVAKRMLEKLGFEVLLAPEGEVALQLLSQHGNRIRCVLLDLTMPRMSGEETFKRLLSIRADLPVILSSGFNEQDAVSRFTDAGLAGFLGKPFTMAQLQRAFYQVLPDGNSHSEQAG